MSYIEGKHAVEEAFFAGVPISKLYVSDVMFKSALVKKFISSGVKVSKSDSKCLSSMSQRGAHQGIIAKTKEFKYAELSELLASATSSNEMIVILDHITDQGNLGAIIRSAEVVGAAGVIIPKDRAAGIGVGAYKTSAGALAHIPVAQVINLANTLDVLKENGFWCCGASEHTENTIWSAPLSGRIALVMGSEGEGISRLVLKKCDFIAKLPQAGHIESLNVSCAAAVFMYEWLRQCSKENNHA